MIKSFLIIPEGMIRMKHANTLGNMYFYHPRGDDKNILIIPEGMIRIKHANTLGNVYFIIPEGVIKSFLIITEGIIRIKYANTLGNVYFIIPERGSSSQGFSSRKFLFTKGFLHKGFPSRRFFSRRFFLSGNQFTIPCWATIIMLHLRSFGLFEARCCYSFFDGVSLGPVQRLTKNTVETLI